MKRTTLLTLLIVSIFHSCAVVSSDEEIDQEVVVTTGKWNILMFFDESGDKAKPFANYNFTFIKDGTVQATKSSDVTSGTWSFGEVSNKSKRMALSFTDNAFEPLGQEWIVKEITNNKIELIRFDNEGTENLVFTR